MRWRDVTARRTAVAALAAAALVGACGDESEATRPFEVGADEGALESGRVGHVHVVVQPREDDLGPAPAIRIEARFAEFRGLDQGSARRRANIPRDPTVGLGVGQCAPTDRLTELPSEVDDDRELTLLDGGDLRVSIGGRDLVVPLALVPDLLPWVSGVEYIHDGAETEALAAAPDGTVPVAIQLEGAPDDDLGGFDLLLDLPPAFELLPAVETATEEDAGALHLRWEPPGESTDLLVLTLTAHAEVAPVGGDVTCLVWDSGQARFDMAMLQEAGLAEGDLIRVTASRTVRTRVTAGAFRDVDVVLELRDQHFVPAP